MRCCALLSCWRWTRELQKWKPDPRGMDGLRVAGRLALQQDREPKRTQGKPRQGRTRNRTKNRRGGGGGGSRWDGGRNQIVYELVSGPVAEELGSVRCMSARRMQSIYFVFGLLKRKDGKGNGERERKCGEARGKRLGRAGAKETKKVPVCWKPPEGVVARDDACASKVVRVWMVW